MAKLINKMLNFVGWETEEAQETPVEKDAVVNGEKFLPMHFLQTNSRKAQENKVVSIHPNSQFQVVVTQPENIDNARDICDHLREKKPVLVNLEENSKESAQRIIDFLSGAVYSLDGTIQKVSSGIFIIAPNNVDIMGEFKDELKNKCVFPWVK